MSITSRLEQWPDPKQGTLRLLRYLEKHHTDLFVQTGKDRKHAMSKSMDALGLAAMIVDRLLKDWKAERVLKHFRHALCMNVCVPFLQCKNFSEEYVKPMEGLFEHQYENGAIENIEWSYEPY